MSIGLRPMLPADGPALAAIFQEAVLEGAADDYGEAALAAWASLADAPDFAARLTAMLTLVATQGGEPVGFASLKGNDRLEMLYVRPEAGRQGVGTRLVEALEALAGARGAKRLEVEASETAEPLFLARGYERVQRSTVMIEGEWLARTLMRKTLARAQEGTA